MSRRLLHKFRAIPMTQPIGSFYVAVIPSTVLAAIAHTDVRRFADAGTSVEQYVGVQRRLDPKREKEIAEYVSEPDATFPTSVVVAIEDERCLEFNDAEQTLSIFSVSADDDGPGIDATDIATILDGQHRIAGLLAANKTFDLSVTIFPAIDIAEQALIFATVNLAQTKVNASLAYDLLSYARSRSPERTCHDVAVALNNAQGSPFHFSIKRLGSKTPGVDGETLSQATFVRALLPFISRTPRQDRLDLRNGIPLREVLSPRTLEETPLRNLFIREDDSAIADILWDYFDSVKAKWIDAWDNPRPGIIIRRTNGFRGFMNVFGKAFKAVGGNDKFQPTVSDFAKIWECSDLNAADFTRDIFVPGTSGERALTQRLTSAVNEYRTHNMETA